MIIVHLHQEHDNVPMSGDGFDLFGHIPRRQEHAIAGAMRREDAIVFSERFAAGRDVELSGNFNDPEGVGDTRLLPPFRVAPDETRDEGRVGDARLPLILAEPQETAASRTVCVEVHPGREWRTRSRSVWDKKGRSRESASGATKADSLGRGARIDAIGDKRFTLAFIPEVSSRFGANATIDGLFPQLTGNPRAEHRVPSLIAHPVRGRRKSSTAR